MGLLRGFGINPNRRKADPSAMELGFGPGPHLLHRRHALAHHLPSMVEIGAQDFVLLPDPSGAHTQSQAPCAEVVQRGGRLGQQDRVALRDQAYGAADAQPGGGLRRHRHHHEQIGDTLIPPWRLAARWVGRVHPHREKGMLAHAEHVESIALGRGRHRPGRIGLIGKWRQQRDVELTHDSIAFPLVYAKRPFVMYQSPPALTTGAKVRAVNARRCL